MITSYLIAIWIQHEFHGYPQEQWSYLEGVIKELRLIGVLEDEELRY